MHARVWGLYLRWAEQVGDRVWRRLLKVSLVVLVLVVSMEAEHALLNSIRSTHP